MGATLVPPPAATDNADNSDNADARFAEDLTWLYEVLGQPDPQPRTNRYLARRSGNDLSTLIPLDFPRSAAALFRRADDGRTTAEWAMSLAGRRLAHAGLLPSAGWLPALASAPVGDVVALPEPALIAHLRQRLHCPDLVAAITLGPRRRNRKPVLQLLLPDGTTVGFAKVGWSPLTHQLVETENQVLRSIANDSQPQLHRPEVIDSFQLDDRQVVVASKVILPGQRRPPFLGRRTMNPATLVRAVAGLLPVRTQPIDALDWGHHPPMAELVTKAKERHRHTQVDVGLWHGDLTPWNVCSTPTEAGVWDWEFANPARPVGFDALHHHFERHRRAAGGTNSHAVEATLAAAPAILAPLGYPRNTANADAIVDFYLIDLLGREHNLAGQRWDGGAIGTLGSTLLPCLQARLERL